MSRRTRARPRPTRQRLPWLPVLAVLAGLVAVGWWAFAREDVANPVEAGAARPIAAYRPPDIHALAVHPADPNVVLFGSHRGMLISRDAGKSWVPIGPRGDAMGIAIPPGSTTAYAAGHDMFFRSDDGGKTWASDRPALPGTDIHGFAASAVTPGRFYAFVVGHGLFRSDDGGATWALAGNAPGSTMSMAVAGNGDQDILFASTMEGAQRSRDGGATWDRVSELGNAYVGASGARVYAAAGPRVFVSGDAGASWETRTFSGGNAVLIASAPTEPDTVYVLAEGFSFWRSTDGGRTWERMS